MAAEVTDEGGRSGGIPVAVIPFGNFVILQILNAVSFVLGTAQLVLYMAYRKKKPSAAAGNSDDEDVEMEEGVARLMGQVEMAQRRGLSLPKLSVVGPLWSPRDGFGSIIKSLSATPVELHSVLQQHYGHGRFEAAKKDDDVEANR